MQGLSREDILRAFDGLSQALQRANARAEIAIMGGAAMVLVHNARQATKDVDAVFVTGPVTELRRMVRDVGRALNLPADWLNDAAKGYMHGSSEGRIVFASETLTVKSLSDAQLLAMKFSAWRDDVDIADARLLLATLPDSRDEVWERVRPYVAPGRELKARYAYDDLWEQTHGVP